MTYFPNACKSGQDDDHILLKAQVDGELLGSLLLFPSLLSCRLDQIAHKIKQQTNTKTTKQTLNQSVKQTRTYLLIYNNNSK